MVVKMVVRPIAKPGEGLIRSRRRLPGPASASTIASVSRLHAPARLDHCAGATQWTLGQRCANARGFCRVRGQGEKSTDHTAEVQILSPLQRKP